MDKIIYRFFDLNTKFDHFSGQIEFRKSLSMTQRFAPTQAFASIK